MHWQLPAALWFLVILYAAELIAWLVISRFSKYGLNKVFAILLLMLLFAAALVTSWANWWGPLSACTTFAALAFYLLGYWGKEFYVRMSACRYQWIQMALSFSICAVIIHATGDSMQMYKNHIPYYCLLTSLAGTWGVFLLSGKIAGGRTEKLKKASFWLGRNTLCIMCLHPLCISIAWRVIGANIDNYMLKHIVCLSFIAVAVYVGTVLINKYIPQILGKEIKMK